jgi:putative MFS transporter
LVHSNVANRLDRLPIASFHKYILYTLAFAYFFEFGDTNTFAVIAPQLIKQWGISVNTIAFITSISFLGMFIGSIGGGWIADKFGRKKAITITVAFFSLFSLLNAFGWDAWSIGAFRFLTGVGLAAMTVVCNTYISEMFPGKFRGKYMALAIVIGICGTPITTWLARFIIPLNTWSWRLVFVWGAFGILILLLSRKLVESPRWYESRKEYDQADAIMKQIESVVSKEKGELPPAAKPVEVVKTPKMPISTLFKGKYLKITLLLTVLWVTQTVGFFGFSSWAPTLLFKQGIDVEKSLGYVAFATLGAPLGSYIAALISDRFDRKWLLVFSGVMIAISGLLYGLTFNPVLIVVFGLMVNIFERIFTPLGYSYSPELYPVEARAIGSGIPYGIGRLANLIGPLLISFIFTHNGYKAVFYFIAGTWLVGALAISLFGPSIKKANLTENEGKVGSAI